VSVQTKSSPNDFHPEESPIAWFWEMLAAVDNGAFDRAAEAQRQLVRLEWRVDRRKPRHKANGQGGGR
jgi:hypothetical protein